MRGGRQVGGGGGGGVAIADGDVQMDGGGKLSEVTGATPARAPTAEEQSWAIVVCEQAVARIRGAYKTQGAYTKEDSAVRRCAEALQEQAAAGVLPPAAVVTILRGAPYGGTGNAKRRLDPSDFSLMTKSTRQYARDHSKPLYKGEPEKVGALVE